MNTRADHVHDLIGIIHDGRQLYLPAPFDV
jgi:hypothetical protein